MLKVLNLSPQVHQVHGTDKQEGRYLKLVADDVVFKLFLGLLVVDFQSQEVDFHA
jgi:hypothetical protein